MKSFACLGSPLKSLLAEVAALGSLSLSSFSFLPRWSRSQKWYSFSRSAYRGISSGVSLREVSVFSQRFYPLTHPSPALDVLPDSLRLLSSVFIMPPFATPLTGGARVPSNLVGDVVAF